MIVLDDHILLFHSLECVAENVNDRPPRPFARQGNGILPSEPLDDQVHLFHSLEMSASQRTSMVVRQGRSQGKGYRMTISRMIDDLPPASFEKCGDEHHSNRKEQQTLLPAPGMTARGQLASLPPQVRAGSRKVRTDLARRFATAA